MCTSHDLQNFMHDSVAYNELTEGCVGKVFHFMLRLGMFELEGPATKLAWKVMHYTNNYAKAPLQKVMSSPEAYEVLKAKLEELRQQRGL